MTDKEQEIIDGVNVSKCKHYEKHSFYDCNETCEDNGAIVCTNCEDNSNCYFKQLQRKEQECEKLKAYAQRQENQREAYYKEFLKKDKALEEIEKIVEIAKEDYRMPEDEWNKILDIINKAKDGE